MTTQENREYMRLYMADRRRLVRAHIIKRSDELTATGKHRWLVVAKSSDGTVAVTPFDEPLLGELAGRFVWVADAYRRDKNQ